MRIACISCDDVDDFLLSFRGGQFPRHIPLSVSLRWLGVSRQYFLFFPVYLLACSSLLFILSLWLGLGAGWSEVLLRHFAKFLYVLVLHFASASSWSQVNNGGRFGTHRFRIGPAKEMGMDWTDSAPGATPNNLQTTVGWSMRRNFSFSLFH